MSYDIDTRIKKISSVHVHLLKGYVRRRDELLVKRVTTVLELDTSEDQIESRYSEVKILDSVHVDSRKKYLADILQDFEGILTKKPWFSELISFEIDTGTHKLFVLS